MSNFENEIKQWLQLDNKIKELTEHIKMLREQRDILESNLTTYATNNKLSNVKVGDNSLKFYSVKVPEPLTFKYLEKSLSDVFKDEGQAKKIVEHIKQKRLIKTVSQIKRFKN